MVLWGMENDLVKTACFTPFDLVRGQEKLYRLLLIATFSSLILPGCVTSDTSAPLAPQPPEINITSIEDPRVTPHYFTDAAALDPVVTTTTVPDEDTGLQKRADAISSEAERVVRASVAKDKCRVQDRFDRKAVLAYEWGYERIGLDVDGVSFDGGDDSGVRLQYTMNLQRKKNGKQKCRYSSKWQGLVGSGYNEMFVRQDDTVWEDLRDIRKDVSDYVNDRF